MLDEYRRFIIDDFGKKPAFASFLPGLSGRKGIPIWSFYCNRGQGITSFGTQNKDNSIMETIEYTPSIILYKEGKPVAFLDANSNKDIKYYESVEGLTKWFNKYTLNKK